MTLVLTITQPKRNYQKSQQRERGSTKMAMKARNQKQRQTQMPTDYEFRKTIFCELIGM
jgi:hypothetical protein